MLRLMEQRIRNLCEQLLGEHDDRKSLQIVLELRAALRDYIERMRNDLLVEHPAVQKWSNREVLPPSHPPPEGRLETGTTAAPLSVHKNPPAMNTAEGLQTSASPKLASDKPVSG